MADPHPNHADIQRDLGRMEGQAGCWGKLWMKCDTEPKGNDNDH